MHRFIRLSPLESKLIHTLPFQRLHYIHQLGITFLVYPGAMHRRFEHSLGAMELATRIYDEVMGRSLSAALPSATKTALIACLPAERSPELFYWRAILRFAALCHDLGHLPFSHAAEKQLLGPAGHEKWTAHLIKSAHLLPIWEAFAKCSIKRDVVEDLLKIALGPKTWTTLYPDLPPLTSWEQLVSEMLTGDFFGADRIDYLLRDAQCSGLAYGTFDYHQLLETLHVLPSDGKANAFALGVEQNGIASCEALLLSRHYMYKRLYQHPTVKAYSFHLQRFMKTVCGTIDETVSVDAYLHMTDHQILTKLSNASVDAAHPGHRDAVALYLRGPRLEALPIAPGLSDQVLEELRYDLCLSPENMAWELKAPSKRKSPRFLFPSSRQAGRLFPQIGYLRW